MKKAVGRASGDSCELSKLTELGLQASKKYGGGGCLTSGRRMFQRVGTTGKKTLFLDIASPSPPLDFLLTGMQDNNFPCDN